MKKLFAALLAFLMVFTVMPAAFSAAATEMAPMAITASRNVSFYESPSLRRRTSVIFERKLGKNDGGWSLYYVIGDVTT